MPGDMRGLALRKVSLRQLKAAIAEHRKNGTPLSDDIQVLAGIQRIQYVFVYPQHNDIILAGPGEAWNSVPKAKRSARPPIAPVMFLDDLLVVRCVRSPRPRKPALAVRSIPRPMAYRGLQALLKRTPMLGDDASEALTAFEQTLGPQTITLTGVPETSHFARVLVAADYRMKRLAMGFEESPVRGLPSFLQMLKSSSKSGRSMTPRWRRAPNYDARFATRMAWRGNCRTRA